MSNRRYRWPARKGTRRRPSWETLEDRAMLAAYWVAVNGSDGQSGSQTLPWRTLQHAADQVAAGDTVHVMAGTYRGFDLRTSGNAQHPIRFLAQPGVVINQNNPVTIDGINLEGADYVVIDGFEITAATRAGIRSVENHHVTLTNNHAHDNGRWGIFTGFSDDLLIEGNITTNSGIEHGIYVSNSADRPVIRNNLIYGNRANGIHMNGDGSLGGDGVIWEALVEGNVIYNNGTGGGSGINGDGLVNSIIRNNLIYNTHSSGISLYQIDGGEPATGNLVVGNTVIVASDGRWGLNIQDGSTGNTILNNVFYSHHSFRGAVNISPDSLPGTVSDYNVVEDRFTTTDGDTSMTFAAWRAATGLDAHSLVGTPNDLFVDPAGGDFHLKPGSAAINAGVAVTGWTLDFEGQPRPMGSGYDIGADEFFEAGPSAAVAGRYLFYNQSAFDGGDPAANADDDQAIATDKLPLLPGQTASLANYSSYYRGINGILIDLTGRTASESLLAGDFTFRVGNSHDTGTWAEAPAPAAIITRAGEGPGNSDRIHVTWPSGAIEGKWLEVRLHANARTQLTSDDVFYFGNAVGETGNSAAHAMVDAGDFAGVRNNPRTFLDPAAIDNAFDFNRDRLVNSSDLLLVRDRATTIETALRLIMPTQGGFTSEAAADHQAMIVDLAAAGDDETLAMKQSAATAITDFSRTPSRQRVLWESYPGGRPAGSISLSLPSPPRDEPLAPLLP